jgi:hypothetical protein
MCESEQILTKEDQHMSKPELQGDEIILRQASWTFAPSYFTDSYLGENTPDMLARAGIIVSSRENKTFDDDVEELFGLQPAEASTPTGSCCSGHSCCNAS